MNWKDINTTIETDCILGPMTKTMKERSMQIDSMERNLRTMKHEQLNDDSKFKQRLDIVFPKDMCPLVWNSVLGATPSEYVKNM